MKRNVKAAKTKPADSKSAGGDTLGVRLPLPVPEKTVG